MSEPNGQVPVPLAGTVRFVRGKYCRFPLTYWGGTGPSLCLVEVIAADPAGNAPATVVLHGLSTDWGYSLTNSIERAAMAVADLVPAETLDPSRARWVQAPEAEGDTWQEVTYESCTYSEADRRWEYINPSWQPTEPVRFDEASGDPDVFYATEYRPIPAGDPVELRLDETDCHERRTGRCSLKLDAPSDDERSEASWGYCRGLADVASLWMFVKNYLRETDCELGGVSEAVDAARSGWSAPYGTIGDVDAKQVARAYELYRHRAPGAAWIESECWSFGDGQHRWCAARHAGLAVPIELHVVRRRLDNDPAPNVPLADSDG